MARRSRKGKNSKTNTQPLLVGIGALALVVICILLWPSKTTRSIEPTPNFRVADYRHDGSRFAVSGNTYIFDGRVENIETIGNDLIVSISIPDNPNEMLPLLVPAQVRPKVNLTRGDRFIFETSCRTGRTADGEQVKGVLIVKNAETR